MTLPQYLQLIAVALYNETALEGYGRYRVGDIVDKYALGWKIAWARNVVDELDRQGWARVYRVSPDPLDHYFSIAPFGIIMVERETALEGIAAFFSRYNVTYNGPHTDISGHPVDSALWTGRPSSATISIRQRETLVSLLGRAESDLESLGASNAEKAMARAYIIAARALAESPEPADDLIWEMIARANQLAGVTSLFVSIVALLVSAGK